MVQLRGVDSLKKIKEMVIHECKNKKTGEEYKTEEEWKAQNIAEEDIQRDVHVLMPSLDLFGKTK